MRWILNAKNPITDYKAGLRIARATSAGADIWLYNARTFEDLAAQMKTFRSGGYLHWAIDWRENPLAVIGLTAWAALPAFDDLLFQLKEATGGAIRAD